MLLSLSFFRIVGMFFLYQKLNRTLLIWASDIAERILRKCKEKYW